MKPIRSPRTPEAELRASQPAGGQAGSPGQLGSRLSGQREPTVTTPEQLQPYLVHPSPFLPMHKAKLVASAHDYFTFFIPSPHSDREHWGIGGAAKLSALLVDA